MKVKEGGFNLNFLGKLSLEIGGSFGEVSESLQLLRSAYVYCP